MGASRQTQRHQEQTQRRVARSEPLRTEKIGWDEEVALVRQELEGERLQRERAEKAEAECDRLTDLVAARDRDYAELADDYEAAAQIVKAFEARADPAGLRELRRILDNREHSPHVPEDGGTPPGHVPTADLPQQEPADGVMPRKRMQWVSLDADSIDHAHRVLGGRDYESAALIVRALEAERDRLRAALDALREYAWQWAGNPEEPATYESEYLARNFIDVLSRHGFGGER